MSTITYIHVFVQLDLRSDYTASQISRSVIDMYEGTMMYFPTIFVHGREAEKRIMQNCANWIHYFAFIDDMLIHFVAVFFLFVRNNFSGFGFGMIVILKSVDVFFDVLHAAEKSEVAPWQFGAEVPTNETISIPLNLKAFLRG